MPEPKAKKPKALNVLARLRWTPLPAELRAARMRLLIEQPFFGVLLMGLRYRETDQVLAFATDGTYLLYNRKHVETETQDNLVFQLMHEVMHCAYKHALRVDRGKERDRERWNFAGDFAINRDLKDIGMTLPKGAYYHPRFDGMTTEEIYDYLEERNLGGEGDDKKPGESFGGSKSENEIADMIARAAEQPLFRDLKCNAAPGESQAGEDGDLDTDTETDFTEGDWDEKLEEAQRLQQSTGCGNVPRYFRREVEISKEPVKIDWRTLLRRFVDETKSWDYSFMRPNRRFLWQGIVLPRNDPDHPSHIVAMVDTSGSISKEDLANFKRELQAILDCGAADRMTVAWADTQVHGHKEFAQGDILDFVPSGGGGTSFRQPMAWIASNMRDATVILYLTDCCVNEWGEKPKQPVLWVTSGDEGPARVHSSRAPFGQAILLAAKGKEL